MQSCRMVLLSNGDKVFVRNFPGPTTDNTSFYAAPTSRRRSYGIVMRTGVNELNNKNDSMKVAKDVLTVEEPSKLAEYQLFISGLISTAEKDSRNRIDNINKSLEDACSWNNIGFIRNKH